MSATDHLGNQFLPGMEHMEPQAPRHTVSAPPATSGRWSGPPVGQAVMGVHNAVHGVPTSAGDFTPHTSFEVDRHGFVYEPKFAATGMTRVGASADKAAGNPDARTLYAKFGGGQDRNPSVREHWEQQPVHQVRSDTPVHTGQDYDTTEFKSTPSKPGGRERIEGIRSSLRQGEEIRDPAWLVRTSGRLYSMDGHHRIVASREEGKETYPARIWDLDAERKKR